MRSAGLRAAETEEIRSSACPGLFDDVAVARVGTTGRIGATVGPRSGRFLSCSVRFAPETAGSLARWLDLEPKPRHHGTCVTGADPRDFLRSLFDEGVQEAICSGARELVADGKGDRLEDWHNPFFDAAFHAASSPQV